MTIITDQEIKAGDVINSPLHIIKDTADFINFKVVAIIEQRKSKGDWKVEPPMWVKIKYIRA